MVEIGKSWTSSHILDRRVRATVSRVYIRWLLCVKCDEICEVVVVYETLVEHKFLSGRVMEDLVCKVYYERAKRDLMMSMR